MTRPAFDKTEQYLVDYYQSREARGWSEVLGYDGYFALPAILFVFCGLRQDDPIMIATGFGILLLHRAIESYRTVKWGHVLHSIVRKYEACLESAGNSSTETERTGNKDE